MYEERNNCKMCRIPSANVATNKKFKADDRKLKDDGSYAMKDITNFDLLCNETKAFEETKTYPSLQPISTYSISRERPYPNLESLPTYQKDSTFGDNVASTELLRENSYMINIYSNTCSLWRGNMWSKIKFKITLDKQFLPRQEGGSSYYELAAFVECKNGKSSKLLNPSTCIGMKIEFERNGIKDSCKANIDTNPYNSAELTIHQDFFDAGEEFYLVVKALKFKIDPLTTLEPTYFGRSQNIM